MKLVLTEDDLCFTLFKALGAGPDKDSLEIAICNRLYAVKFVANKIEQKYFPEVTDITPTSAKVLKIK